MDSQRFRRWVIVVALVGAAWAAHFKGRSDIGAVLAGQALVVLALVA